MLVNFKRHYDFSQDEMIDDDNSSENSESFHHFSLTETGSTSAFIIMNATKSNEPEKAK